MNEMSCICTLLFLGMIVWCLEGIGRELCFIRVALEKFTSDDTPDEEEAHHG